MRTAPIYNRAMPALRYRLLARLRESAPDPIAERIPYPADCGDHSWCRVSETTDGCRYCLTDRPHVAQPLVPGSAEWNGLLEGIAHGGEASAAIFLRRLEETQQTVELGAREALMSLERPASGPPVADPSPATSATGRAHVAETVERLRELEHAGSAPRTGIPNRR